MTSYVFIRLLVSSVAELQKKIGETGICRGSEQQTEDYFTDVLRVQRWEGKTTHLLML